MATQTSIAKMAVQLVAHSAGFAAGLSPGRTAIKNIQRDIQGLHSTARMAFAGLGAYISVAAFRGVANEILRVSDAAENLVKQSERMGTTASAFRELEYAVGQAGMEIGEIQVPINMMLKNLSGVGEEAKKSQRALSYLGISAKDLRAAGPTDALAMIAQGLERYSDSFTRAGIISAIFGRQWQGMAPILAMGSESLRALTAEGQRLNLVSSDEIERAAEYNDAIKRLRYVWEGFKMKAVSIITPDMVALVDQWTEKLRGIGPDFWEGVKTQFQGIVDMTEQMAVKWKTIGEMALLAYGTAKGARIGGAVGGPGGAIAGGAVGFGATSLGIAEAKKPGSIWDEAKTAKRDIDSWIGKTGAGLVLQAQLFVETLKNGLGAYGLTGAIPQATERMLALRQKLDLLNVPRPVAKPHELFSIPNLQSMAKSAISENRNLFNSLIPPNADEDMKALIDEQNRLEELADKLKDKLRTPFEGLYSTLSDLSAMGIRNLLSPEQLGIGRVDALDDYVKSLKDLGSESISAQSRLELLGSTLNEMSSFVEQGQINWDEYGAAANRATSQFLDSFKSMREYLESPQEKMNEKMDTLSFMFDTGMISAEKYQYGQSKLWEEMYGAAEKYGTQINNITENVMALTRALSAGKQVETFGEIAQARVTGITGPGGRMPLPMTYGPAAYPSAPMTTAPSLPISAPTFGPPPMSTSAMSTGGLNFGMGGGGPVNWGSGGNGPVNWGPGGGGLANFNPGGQGMGAIIDRPLPQSMGGPYMGIYADKYEEQYKSGQGGLNFGPGGGGLADFGPGGQGFVQNTPIMDMPLPQSMGGAYMGIYADKYQKDWEAGQGGLNFGPGGGGLANFGGGGAPMPNVGPAGGPSGGGGSGAGGGDQQILQVLQEIARNTMPASRIPQGVAM